MAKQRKDAAKEDIVETDPAAAETPQPEPAPLEETAAAPETPETVLSIVEDGEVELVAPTDITAIGLPGGQCYHVADGKVMARPEHVGLLMRQGCRQEER